MLGAHEPLYGRHGVALRRGAFSEHVTLWRGSCARVFVVKTRHAVAGISDSQLQTLTTDARVRGKATKQWKPIGNHIPATPWCFAVTLQWLVCSRPNVNKTIMEWI